MYHIGEKFILTLDNRIKDVMLIAHDGKGFIEAYLLDLDLGTFAYGPMGIVKSKLNKNKGRFYLTENQMKGLIENPKECLMSIGAGFPEMVLDFDADGEARVVSTEAIQMFFIDDQQGFKSRVLSPAHIDDVKAAQKKIAKYWEEGWE
ncbi:hypothetical protein DRO91_07970 [Candidatus Heimdallarchaeota archaeon]|nr:MAG: hypothetical protein DRO91_07970 [Candidatus Heimdallarchaeota archaeon]